MGIDRALSTSSRLGVQASTETVEFDSDNQTDFDRNEAYLNYEYSSGERHGLTVKAGYTWLASDAGDRSAPLLEVLLSRQLSPSVEVQLELASQFSDAGVEFAVGVVRRLGLVAVVFVVVEHAIEIRVFAVEQVVRRAIEQREFFH